VGLLLAAAAVLVAADPPPPTPAELAQQLADRDFRTREDASKKLWELGESARPALEAALKSKSPEAVRRAKKILDQFNRGIFPDTPKELLDLINQFIADADGNRFDIARKLITFGPKGVAALAQQLRKGFGSAEERDDFFRELQEHLRAVVPGLLFDGKAAEAEALLRLNTYGPALSAQLDYAVFQARRGKGKELVAHMTDVRALPGDVGRGAGTGLLCAYRVTGRRDKLKPLLAELTKEDRGLTALREGLLMDIDDWATLAAEVPDAANSADGLKAFRLRMAGKEKEAAELLAEVKATDHASVGGYALDDGALALLLNGRTEDGIARLKATETAPHVLTDLLAVRLQFRDAMDAITAGLAAQRLAPDDDFDPAGARMTNLYLAKKGRILSQLGQRDAAAQVFAKMSDGLNSYDTRALLQLIKAEVRSGFPDMAAELLGTAQAKYDADGNSSPSYSGQDPYEILFDADADAAIYWWNVLRQSRPKDDGAKRMVAIRRLLVGKLPAAEVKQLLAEAAKFKPLASEGGDRRYVQSATTVTPYRKAVGLAAAQRAVGDTAAAVATLTAYANLLSMSHKPFAPGEEILPDQRFGDRAPGSRQWVFGVDESFRLWLDLSELLIAQKKPTEAAAALLDGWRLDPQNGLLLYFSGRALVRAGDAKEGDRRIALSHEVSLANSRYRGRFLEELVNRGEPAADIRAERDAARLSTWLTEGNTGNVWNQIARASATLKDYPEAASANRRAIHYVLRTPGVTYVEGYAYVNVLATVKGYEARQLLAAGKTDAAVAAAREALVLLPTYTELVIGLAQGLDKAGRTADADALFRQTWDAFGTVIKGNPDTAWARHSAAWLAAGCRRELDAALAYSKKAVELEPDSKSHRSGLAETHFRKGDRATAVAVMTKLVAEDRHNHFFRRQLDRYKTTPFDSPLPDGDDD
jgi:tetratricopeptide (TPR) repeat protein